METTRRALVEGFELLRFDAYQDERGVWTVGYGHTRGVKRGDQVTRIEADDLLTEDLAIAEADVLQVVKVPLTAWQLDALVSLAFNIGGTSFHGSTVARELNAGNFHAASEAFSMWRVVHVDGKPTFPDYQRARRAKEQRIFLVGH